MKGGGKGQGDEKRRKQRSEELMVEWRKVK
jgi:hypothetical protein